MRASDPQDLRRSPVEPVVQGVRDQRGRVEVPTLGLPLRPRAGEGREELLGLLGPLPRPVLRVRDPTRQEGLVPHAERTPGASAVRGGVWCVPRKYR